jgi:phosphosulfolactate synthase
VVIGGTFWEACLAQGRLAEWKDFIGDLGLRHVEVSDGTVDVPHEQKLACIEEYAADFTVLSEVGSKDGNAVIAPYRWVEMIRGELDAGAWKVITEARESGTAGVFRGDGEVRSGLIDEIAQSVDVDRLLFEAPQKAQQVWFIRAFGPNVNLGNIPPDEVIPLETLRLGLRSDTLRTMPGTGSPDGAAL